MGKSVTAALACNTSQDRDLIRRAVLELARTHGHDETERALAAMGRAGITVLAFRNALRLAEAEMLRANVQALDLPQFPKRGES